MTEWWRQNPLPLVIAFCSLLSLWRMCHTCLQDSSGRFYTGDMNRSVSGKICQPWSIARGAYSLLMLQIRTFSDVGCRNPNRSSSLWCYTSKDTTEKCVVPICADNPKANYCMVIPKNHFQTCPILFSQKGRVNMSDLHKLEFCCLTSKIKAIYLLPRDSCLITVLKREDVSHLYRFCPDGFSIRAFYRRESGSNHVYRCCRLGDSQNLDGEWLSKAIEGLSDKVKKVSPIFGAVLLEGFLCKHTKQFRLRTVRFSGKNDSTIWGDLLPTSITICLYYYSVDRPTFDPLLLGLMSMKQCPPGFNESYNQDFQIIFKFVRIKFCWPTYISNIYNHDQICLSSQTSINETLLCPREFQSYEFLWSSRMDSRVRFCCRTKNTEGDHSSRAIEMTSDTSVTLLSMSTDCSVFQKNSSIEGILVNAKLSLPGLTHTISLCNYELKKDKFAYKKIGPACPWNMSYSKVVFQTIDQEDWTSSMNNHVMEYCVGDNYDPFPEGRFCVYKVSRKCPSGFFVASVPQKRDILIWEGLVPDYGTGAICCRGPTNINGTSINGTFPFVKGIKPLVSFGLLLQNDSDVCPTVSGYVSHSDIDMDGAYCSFRSEEDDYRWRHENVWPIPDRRLTDRLRPFNATLSERWTRVSNHVYVSSIITKYPIGKFCILSQGSCSSNARTNIVINYPLKGFFVCCASSSGDSIVIPPNSLRYLTKNLSVGYIAMEGKCPPIDEDLFDSSEVVHDEFLMPPHATDHKYVKQLMKIGITPSLINGSLKVDFKFCIFRSKDMPRKQRIGEYIKPLETPCPSWYREQIRVICFNQPYQIGPLEWHFINQTYISTCVPVQGSQPLNGLLPHPFCNLFSTTCSLGTTMTEAIGGPCHSPRHLQVCCPRRNFAPYSHYRWPPEFSLPLSPSTRECPLMANYSSLMWKVGSSPQYLPDLCYYYRPPRLLQWPSGMYLTVAYKNRCPSGFKLEDHNSSSLCVRVDKRPSFSRFPDGNYCVLITMEGSCPETATWNLRVSLFGNYSICCSDRRAVILNVLLEDEHAFSFLSMGTCSIIPGATVQQTRFLSFRNIVRCIYVKNDCDDDGRCSSKIGGGRQKKNVEEFLLTRQKIIISLLVSILVVMFIVGAAFIGRGRLKRSQVEDMRMAPIYSRVDSTLDYELKENFEDTTPSIIYSTIS